jgi:hypothetical protein
MRVTMQKLRNKGAAFRAVVIFLIAYAVFLVSWIQVKDYYGTAVTVTASKLLTLTANVAYDGSARSGDDIVATFSPLSRREMLIDITVPTSSYTFNAPLTFAFMAALWLFLEKRGKAYSQALLILLGIHLLYVFSFETKTLTDVLVHKGTEQRHVFRLFFSQFLWSFTDNMVIRFEPFLIGFYMYIRFGKQRSE